MKRSATITLALPTRKLAQTLFAALTPETKKPTTTRSKVTIQGKDNVLTIRIEAKDTIALRSTLNTYLRWVKLAKDTYETTRDLERHAERKNT
jgi:KEOPS complex subunit Pcc1